jgi:hypothetical protein
MAAQARNLSLTHIATVLAALGSPAVIAACTKADAPAVRSDQPASSAAAATPPPPSPTASAPGAAADEGRAASSSSAQAPDGVKLERKKGMAGGGGGGSTGQASCGAGTCTADPKKK